MTNSLLTENSTDAAYNTQQISCFLQQIGLEVSMNTLEQETFLPGICITRGVILYDPAKLAHPGDLLHEAGHLAVLPFAQRKQVCGDVGGPPHEEMMAIAWSYAAAVHLGLAASVVFHDAGYRGGANSLIENFTQGHYFGVPTLQWLGLTAEGKRAQELGVHPYPHMIKWLVD